LSLHQHEDAPMIRIPTYAPPRHRRLRALLSVVVALLAVAAIPAQANEPGPPALFTQTQADRGETVFLTNCAGCHGYSMFTIFRRYNNAYDFHSVISLTMPWEDAALLPDADYIAIVAFLMRETGFRAGETELVAERELLTQINPGNARALRQPPL
jgi:mono/diheme cytochrome c family protein